MSGGWCCCLLFGVCLSCVACGSLVSVGDCVLFGVRRFVCSVVYVVVRCWLFVVSGSLCVVRCTCCSVFGVCCLLFNGLCSFSGVCVWCALFVDLWVLLVVGCLLLFVDC